MDVYEYENKTMMNILIRRLSRINCTGNTNFLEHIMQTSIEIMNRSFC